MAQLDDLTESVCKGSALEVVGGIQDVTDHAVLVTQCYLQNFSLTVANPLVSVCDGSCTGYTRLLWKVTYGSGTQ